MSDKDRNYISSVFEQTLM